MSNYDNWKTSVPSDEAAEYANMVLDRLTTGRMRDFAVDEGLCSAEATNEQIEEAVFDFYYDDFYNDERY